MPMPMLRCRCRDFQMILQIVKFFDKMLPNETKRYNLSAINDTYLENETEQRQHIFHTKPCF